MSFIVIIPARYQSTRLPGKALLRIHDKTLIQHVYDCARASAAAQVIIATDDERIEQHARSFTADVQMTAATHSSGTQRIAEVIERRGIAPHTVVVNLQGDEPLMPAQCINQVAALLAPDMQIPMATLAAPLTAAHEISNPNIVKVVMDKDGCALYFSRASIPWDREHFPDALAQADPSHLYRHIGIYAYRAGFVQEYVQMSAAVIERLECLEQLRVLWHGRKIKVGVAETVPGPGVDTQDELERVTQLLAK